MDPRRSPMNHLSVSVLLFGLVCIFGCVSASPVSGCGEHGAGAKAETASGNLLRKNEPAESNAGGKSGSPSQDNDMAVLNRLSATLDELRDKKLGEAGQESSKAKMKTVEKVMRKSVDTIRMIENGVEPHVKVLGGHVDGDERKPKLLDPTGLGDNYNFLDKDEKESLAKYLKSKGKTSV